MKAIFSKSNLLSSTSLSTNAQSLRAAWKLIKPYWTSSDEKKKSYALLGGILGLASTQIGLNLLYNQWNVAFYNAIQDNNGPEFSKQMFVYAGLVMTSVGASVCQTYLSQDLQMRWRQWMTDRYMDKWMDNNTFYHLQTQADSGEGAGKAADNPDQRITDDLNQFTGSTIDLGVGMLMNSVNIAVFTNLLWNLPHSTASFALAGHQFNDVHYLVWSALAYSAAGTYLMHKTGNKLVTLGYNQQKYEADLRYAMVRIRENSESIAMSNGKQVEKETIRHRFGAVVGNWKNIMKKQSQVSSLTLSFDQAVIVFPYLMAAPLYFAKTIKLGNLFQIASAFLKVQKSMGWFVDSYPKLANWRAATNRLTEFNAALDHVKNEEKAATSAATPQKPEPPKPA